MEYRQLGHTDLQVSAICLGTMTWGQQNTEAEGHTQMDYALGQGVNFFDTAEMYSIPGKAETQGSTEKIIGTWFKKTGNRDKVILASKITGPMPYFNYIRQPMGFGKAQLEDALNKSLQRLQTDYLDLYQLHWPERQTNYFGQRGFPMGNDPWQENFQELLFNLQTFMKEGKIRHFGVSNETPWGLMKLLHKAEVHDLPRCVSIQNPYSLLNRTFEIGLSEISLREKIGLLAYSPLGFGRLSGKYNRPGEDLSKTRLTLFPNYKRYNSESSLAAIEAYCQIAENHGLSMAQMALAYVNSRPFVTSNIIGATSLLQLQENLGSIELKLSSEVLQAIEKVHERFPDPAP
jgi:aryl-alcohol dehydrogenase-like predicted oxidoreductase